MDPLTRWEMIRENAVAAQRVEPYRSFGLREWTTWATGVTSALSRAEAQEIVEAVWGIPRTSHECKPGVIRTRLLHILLPNESWP